MNSTASGKHTLFLWPDGYFPKRVVYMLLAKGLCTSMSQIDSGKTNEPALNIVNVTVDGKKFISLDPEEPLPEGKSFPCLRISYPAVDADTWLADSAAIMEYLDEAFPGYRPLRPSGLLDRAIAEQIKVTLAGADADAIDWLVHAAPAMAEMRGVGASYRNLSLGEFYHKALNSKMVKIQSVTGSNLKNTGWLSACPDGGPGLLDVTLAASQRFMEMSWSGVNWLEDPRLDLLREWYTRFKEQGWWREVEEAGRFPVELRNREVEGMDGWHRGSIPLF